MGGLSHQGVLLLPCWTLQLGFCWQNPVPSTEQMGSVGLLGHLWLCTFAGDYTPHTPPPTLLGAEAAEKKFLCTYCPEKATFRQSCSQRGEKASPTVTDLMINLQY